MAYLKTKLIDGKPINIHKIAVHKFSIGDVEDPELYASEIMIEWRDSEQGQFVMTHALSHPTYEYMHDHQNLGYKFVIIAEFEEKKVSEFLLKWGNNAKNYMG